MGPGNRDVDCDAGQDRAQAEGPTQRETGTETRTGEEAEHDVYRGGAGPNGVTNVGGGDGGARLTVAKGVALRETCAGETTNECCNNDRRGGVSYLLTRGRSEMERDCGTNAYWRTYCDVTKTENESA